MKKIHTYFITLLALFATLFGATAAAQETAFNMRLKQRNAADNSDIDRYIAPPAPGSNCLFYFNGSTVLPTCASIGAGLSLTDGVLSSSSAGSTQVNADWTAAAGPARILNKPNIAMVGMTGQFADLVGVPEFKAVSVSGSYNDLIDIPNFSSVATSGSYSDLINRPVIPAAQVPADWSASSGVSRILNKPVLAAVATTGRWADILDKPAIPGSPAARVFGVRTPALNACFQVSATRDAQVSYSVDVTTTLTLVGGARGSVYLRTYTDATCTSGQQTLASGSSGLPAALSVAVGLQNLGSVALPAVIPTGSWVRIETMNDVGTPTFAARAGQEVLL